MAAIAQVEVSATAQAEAQAIAQVEALAERIALEVAMSRGVAEVTAMRSEEVPRDTADPTLARAATVEPPVWDPEVGAEVGVAAVVVGVADKG